MVHLQAVFGPLECLADRVLLAEEALVEVAGEEDGRRIDDCVPLLDTDDVVDPCPVEDLAGELAVAGRNEHELQRGTLHLE